MTPLPSSSLPVQSLMGAPQVVQQTDRSTLADLILLGNDIAFQWWSATQDKPIPLPQYIPGTPIPTQVYQDTTRLMVIGGLALVAVLLLARK